MLACHLWDRARFAPEVQVIGLLYASLVLPLIGLLANRITGMSDRLRSQKSQLQQAMQQLSELATRDELTRTHNRRHMTELMDLQLQQHRRQRLPMCLALLDIDWFKSINDQHGHATGDQVLQRFAAVLQDSLRAGDLLARWGGEEFLLLMPATDAAAGHHALQRLHARVATMQLDGHASELQVTFSAGVAQVDLNAPLEHSLERADQAMYRAKTRGRNRTEVAPDMPGQDQLSPAPRRAPLAEAGEALSAGRRETSPSPP
jgi:diguanylate cyclase (GGDEF)-like protein